MAYIPQCQWQRQKVFVRSIIVVSSDHSRYKDVSLQVHEIFSRYTDLIEPLSIDEAFLDVTGNESGLSAEEIAADIRQRIRKELSLTASAGVSYNKFLAKIASDYNKPDGMYSITKGQALDFIAALPIEKFWGVGPKTARVMHKIGIFNGMQASALYVGTFDRSVWKSLEKCIINSHVELMKGLSSL